MAAAPAINNPPIPPIDSILAIAPPAAGEELAAAAVLLPPVVVGRVAGALIPLDPVIRAVEPELVIDPVEELAAVVEAETAAVPEAKAAWETTTKSAVLIPLEIVG